MISLVVFHFNERKGKKPLPSGMVRMDIYNIVQEQVD